MAVMTAGFGADPVHDLKSAAVVCALLAALLSTPFYLAMFRWCGLGMIGVCCAALVSLSSCLATGMTGPTVLITLLLGLQALICYGIYSASTESDSGER
jgi:hypothetical protein